MTPTIKAIFTDIGGVLLTNGWDQAARDRACQRFGLDAGELHERHHLTFDTYEEGKLSLDEYLERTVFFEPRSFSVDDFRAFMFAQSRALPDMLEFLAAIKAMYQLKVVAVSNEGRELTQHRVQAFRLGDVIDTFVSSCFVHVRKPDADIFNMALDMTQVAAGDVLYLDDRSMFVDVARGLGLNGVVHKTFAETRAEFGALGLQWR